MNETTNIPDSLKFEYIGKLAFENAILRSEHAMLTKQLEDATRTIKELERTIGEK